MPAEPPALSAHYALDALIDRIREGLSAAGADPDAPHPDDLAPIDQFHTGGIRATETLFEPLDLRRGTRVADLGTGLGGTARFLAKRYGAYVTGIDTSHVFVETAARLSRMCRMSRRTDFLFGNALGPPLATGSFDLVTLMHVGMNIRDKRMLFAAAARLLVPGGRLVVYDLMEGGADGEIAYPTPWSPDAAHSFVAPPAAYRSAGAAAGLGLEHERDRSAMAIAHLREVVASTEANGLPPLGLHLLMGDDAPARLGNLVAAAFAGQIAPWEMVFRKPA